MAAAEDAHKATVPTIYAHEGIIDFSYRLLNVPEDLMRGRGSQASKTGVVMSTMCDTEPLTKTKFMAFMHPTCYKRLWHKPDFLLRLLLFDKMKKLYKAPTALGGCRHDTSESGRHERATVRREGAWLGGCVGNPAGVPFRR